MSVDVQEIIRLLGPSSGQPVWNILLYLIFGLALLTLLLMPDKNLIPTLLIASVLLAALVAKLSISATRNPVFQPDSFGQYMVNIVPFVAPIIAAGMIRTKKKTNVIPPAILTAILGGLFFFGFWLFVQRGG